MSLDHTSVRLTRNGTVTVLPDCTGGVRIVVDGFEGEGCTCRDLSVLACVWAIGELQREVLRNIERPGGGEICVC